MGPTDIQPPMGLQIVSHLMGLHIVIHSRQGACTSTATKWAYTHSPPNGLTHAVYTQPPNWPTYTWPLMGLKHSQHPYGPTHTHPQTRLHCTHTWPPNGRYTPHPPPMHLHVLYIYLATKWAHKSYHPCVYICCGTTPTSICCKFTF